MSEMINMPCTACGKPVPTPKALSEQPTADSARWCNIECQKISEREHPELYVDGWVPIEDTLPGGRYDGVWENSGFGLGKPR